jgi:anaerobic dimethyl sulfoxide reductase subunit B (iron-sulfur subunit)
MAKQMAFYFEQKHCAGCKTCQIACKDKNDLRVGQLFRKVYECCGGGYQQQGGAVVPQVFAFWVSISCNHCISPVCVEACPTGAIQKQAEDGIVTIEQGRCIGCRRCVESCPYKAPQYNEVTGKADKCDFCRDYLARGKPPACVAACPLRALHYGPLDTLWLKYGRVNETKGMPSAAITEPALIIAPHRDAMISK